MMNSSGNGTEVSQQQEHVQLFIWRIPKKNHDAMMQNCKRAGSAHTKYGQRLEFFQLDRDMLGNGYGLTNIAKVVPLTAGRDDDEEEEEVWLEINFHKDRKHMEEVAAKRRMEDIESADPIGKEFMELISPGSCIEGGFARIRI